MVLHRYLCFIATVYTIWPLSNCNALGSFWHPGFHSPVFVSHWIRGLSTVWSGPMSLMYCQHLNLKSAIEHFLTSKVSRSIGANAFEDSHLFKALWDVYCTHIYCSIATHPNRKEILKKEQNAFLCVCVSTPNQISFNAYSLNSWVARVVCCDWWSSGAQTGQRVHSLAIPKIFFYEHVLKQPFFFMQLYALLLLKLLISPPHIIAHSCHK